MISLSNCNGFSLLRATPMKMSYSPRTIAKARATFGCDLMEPYGQLAETVFTECLRSCGKRHRLDGCLGGAGRRGGARRIGAQLEGKIRAVEFRSEARRRRSADLHSQGVWLFGRKPIAGTALVGSTGGNPELRGDLV